MSRLGFGAFLAPHHPIGEHPMLQFRRDLDLVEHLDKLGYDEFWCGEHHSSGWEMIGSPEMFLAAAGERSKRIKLATGVVSLPYHHPFNVAQRMVQLDYMTGGRVIFGSGPGALASDAHTLGIDPMLARKPVGKGTQTGIPFAMSDLKQDGYQPGEFISMKISDSGIVTARYSNGEVQSLGQIALGDFRNVQGLRQAGNNTWVETPESGQPVVGAVGTGKFGVVRSGSLEQSNVDLTKELVNMMTAQRTYQANAQTIKTQDQVMATLTNLR